MDDNINAGKSGGTDILCSQDWKDNSQYFETVNPSKGVGIPGGKSKRRTGLQRLSQDEKMESEQDSDNGGPTEDNGIRDTDEPESESDVPEPKRRKSGRRILLDQSIDDGLVHVHFIDNARVDDQDARKRRAKLASYLERKGVHAAMDARRRFFSWATLYLPDSTNVSGPFVNRPAQHYSATFSTRNSLSGASTRGDLRDAVEAAVGYILGEGKSTESTMQSEQQGEIQELESGSI